MERRSTADYALAGGVLAAVLGLGMMAFEPPAAAAARGATTKPAEGSAKSTGNAQGNVPAEFAGEWFEGNVGPTTYWDTQTVENAFGSMVDANVAQSLANKTPQYWKLNGDAETWAEQMANRMMPVSREAHGRLNFNKVTTKSGKRDILGGRAEEKKKTPDGQFYANWAASTVKEQIHIGGWRLAALLEQILQ